MKKESLKANELKYKNLIIAVSVLIPIVVALLFRIKLEGVQPFTFLPPIYAAINGYTAVILIIALWAIKNRRITLHEQLMKTAIGLSLTFLLMYVAYHLTSDPTPFQGEGWVKSAYYFILISHIILSVAIIPLVLISYVRAISQQFTSHRKIAKITFPIWLYITITGVIIYLMISPYYT